jgi:hypothetical protein
LPAPPARTCHFNSLGATARLAPIPPDALRTWLGHHVRPGVGPSFGWIRLQRLLQGTPGTPDNFELSIVRIAGGDALRNARTLGKLIGGGRRIAAGSGNCAS